MYLSKILCVKGAHVKSTSRASKLKRGGNTPKAIRRLINAPVCPNNLSIFPPTRTNGRRTRILIGQKNGTPAGVRASKKI